MDPNFPHTKGCGLILAAGKGTRMRSDKPKVLHTLLGEPMLAYALAAFQPIFGENVLIVAGHQSHLLVEAFPGAQFVFQKEQLGTGHALMAAMEALEKSGKEWVLVANGDTPLISRETLENFLDAAKGADIAFATLTLDDPGAYGRVVRRGNAVAAIVEARDYKETIHGAPTSEVNAGIYLLRLSVIKRLLPRLSRNNLGGEYYITDLVSLGVAEGLDVRGVECGVDATLMGINSPAELAMMEDILARNVWERLLNSGVLIHAPSLARISPFATIEPGVEISAPCEISGQTIIRRGAVVESHCVIRDSLVCQNALIKSFSHLDHASVGEGAHAGPYARLRPGAILEPGSQVGNFVEMKKARLGANSKANHLTYLGDAEIGENVNIGAGTITCNYDGKSKFRTEIGDKAFIGSNTALVAPVRVGAGSLVGAGSVITKDVPEDAIAIARGRQKNMPRKDPDGK